MDRKDPDWMALLGRLSRVVRIPLPRWPAAAARVGAGARAAGAAARGRRYVGLALVAGLAFGVGWNAGGVAHGQEPAANPPLRSPRVVRAVPIQAKVAALTFDDGPNPKYTPEVMKILAENGAHATFFVIGREAARYPELVRAEAAAGNEIGNHGEQHRTLAGLDPAAIEAEARASEQLITDLTGTRPVLYRLPQGRMDNRTAQEMARLGYTIVMWSVDTRDYQRRTPQAIADQVVRQIRPGSIVIFHDGGGNRQATVDALATLLPRLRAEGYQFVTVSQMLEMAQASGQ